MKVQLFAETRESAIAAAKLKAAKWFGVDTACVSISILTTVFYDQRSHTDNRHLSVLMEATEKHSYDTYTTGVPTCRHCKKRKDS